MSIQMITTKDGNVIPEPLKYVGQRKNLKKMGYEFQKLFASNYQSYRKKVHSTTIWVWMLGKTIEINDWHGHTSIIIDFFNTNVDEFQKQNPTKKAMFLSVNFETAEISFQDIMNQSEDKYEVILVIDNFRDVLKEIELINNN